MRKMAIDYGDARIGIALTDPLELTAYGLETIESTNDKKTLKRIEEIVLEYNVEMIILGMPYNVDGTSGFRVEKTENFLHKLKCKFNNLVIETQDERYSSIEADNIMEKVQVKSKDKKKLRDQLAAVNILETYNSNNNKK